MDARRLVTAAPLALTLVGTLFGAATSATAQPSNIWIPSHWHLWRIEVDGTGMMPLDTTPGTRCGSPVWSPDGKYIVYDVSDQSPRARIAVIRADGSERRLLGPGAIPCWSPDGKLILCQEGGKTVMNADGSGREVLPGPAFGLRWSPPGNRIVSMGGPGLTTLELATGDEYSIMKSPYPLFHGYDISSDGLRICYGSMRGGLCLATLDPHTREAKVEQLVDTGIGYHASWSPDDRQIVFAWHPNIDDLIQLYIYDTETRAPPMLVPGIELDGHNVNPDWSPDGKTIVFSKAIPLAQSR